LNQILNKKAACTAIFGTGSDVGKSIVSAALCRMINNVGYRVAPFKAQNMSNNSFVTLEGGEMGRAQVVQAEASRIEPHVDMNPVLLKPTADTGSQVVLHGRAIGDKSSREYWNDTDYLFNKALESLERLRTAYDFIIMEGAGSCAEVNLHDSDFVNFRMAHKAGAAVILVADIDRGGVFGQVVGTLEVLPPEDKDLVKGIIINRFRGDAALFDEGIAYIEKKTRLPVLGLVPHFYHIDIDSEDGVVLETAVSSYKTFEQAEVKIAVLKLPHISNFTDFTVLQRDDSIDLEYLYNPKSLKMYDLVILPGSKNVRFDIEWLRERGWESIFSRYVENGGMLVGICGGYQMLGTFIHDPHGMEGAAGITQGFGFLDIETTLNKQKTLTRVSAQFLENGAPIEGYEIHIGLTKLKKNAAPLIRITSKNRKLTEIYDGGVSANGKVWGCYIHGLFDDPGFRRSFLKKLKPDCILNPEEIKNETLSAFKDRQYELLAEHFSMHLNLPLLWEILGLNQYGI
jgi:adenosylcobyric acid synthase